MNIKLLESRSFKRLLSNPKDVSPGASERTTHLFFGERAAHGRKKVLFEDCLDCIAL